MQKRINQAIGIIFIISLIFYFVQNIKFEQVF